MGNMGELRRPVSAAALLVSVTIKATICHGLAHTAVSRIRPRYLACWSTRSDHGIEPPIQALRAMSDEPSSSETISPKEVFEIQRSTKYYRPNCNTPYTLESSFEGRSRRVGGILAIWRHSASGYQGRGYVPYLFVECMLNHITNRGTEWIFVVIPSTPACSQKDLSQLCAGVPPA
ncbi:hypothetical protein C8R45DRAFT_584799 [Mycena sanguinolenta]|nr:hypothetical protein C8R45DRAFT_584799 [Mycena sanguinolenta]